MARTLQGGLTAEQVRLLERYRPGLLRLVEALCEKRGCEPSELIVLLAHRASRVGGSVREQLDISAGGDVLVVPGLVRELPAWTARLALSGPVYDCTGAEPGVTVIVVDERGEMALRRVDCRADTASSGVQNRYEIPQG